MTAQEDDEGKSQLVEYDVTGKATAIYSQEGDDVGTKRLVAEYLYDDRGFRVAKKVYDEDGTTLKDQTWYVRDASGSLMRSYNTDETLDESPMYGASRLGMYRPKALYNDYLYELSDHLGNVRAVVGGKVTLEYLGTFEAERETEENAEDTDANGNPGYFGNWQSYPISSYNHTAPTIEEDDVPLNLTETSGVLRINNGQDVPVNPIRATKMIPVSPGDKLDLEVYAKIADFSESNESLFGAGDIFTNFLANAFGGLATGTTLDGATIGNIFDQSINPFFDPATLFTAADSDHPKAFLNYIVFDQNFQPVDSDRRQVSSDATLTGSHANLLLQDVEITTPGFIYVYVSNQDQQDMDVYFDDLRISHTYSNIVAGSDFYPFGLTMETRDINREEYKYGYQGQFAEEDEETGWNSFELRMYDPVISRWISTDPAGQFWSPYVGMGNNPVSGVDPDGAYTKWGATWRSWFHSGSYTFQAGEGKRDWAVGFDTWQSDGAGGYRLFKDHYTQGNIVFGFGDYQLNGYAKFEGALRTGLLNYQDAGEGPIFGGKYDAGSIDLANLEFGFDARRGGVYNEGLTAGKLNQSLQLETPYGEFDIENNYNPMTGEHEGKEMVGYLLGRAGRVHSSTHGNMGVIGLAGDKSGSIGNGIFGVGYELEAFIGISFHKVKIR